VTASEVDDEKLSFAAPETKLPPFLLLLTRSGHPPDSVRKVVGYDQRAAPVDRHPDRPTACLAILTHKSFQEVYRRT
jgi:hypothetical protein